MHKWLSNSSGLESLLSVDLYVDFVRHLKTGVCNNFEIQINQQMENINWNISSSSFWLPQDNVPLYICITDVKFTYAIRYLGFVKLSITHTRGEMYMFIRDEGR